MPPLLSLVTLGVHDLDAMKRFYIEKFGWIPLKDSDGIVFFKLNGLLLGLFPKEELAEDAGVPAEGQGFKGFSLAVCLRSEREVDAMFEELEKKGAPIVKKPEKVFWGGYRGYAADVERNLWEIAYNPFMTLDERGGVVSHA
jgi:catechol 2,3-dioxygenase-like lactoylglutathione lyase family enzyme